MLEPLTRATLPVQASRALKRFILERQLAPGDQLPSERYLTEMLGVSRTVVREALHTLVAEGLLHKEASRGVFVREFVPQMLADQPTASGEYVASNRDLLEVRAALEIGALALIAQRITPAEVEELAELVAAMRRALEAGHPLGESDSAFHDALFAAAHNPSLAYFKRFIQDAAVGGAMGMQSAPPTFARPADRNSVETAERMVEALRLRNIDAAQSSMRSHLLIERPPDHARLILFVDDGNIATMHGVKRRIGNQRSAAHKFPHNPLISPEHPWEGENVFPSATVLYDPEALSYRMWYHGSRQLSAREELCALCYATSSDGIHWTKPALEIYPDAPSSKATASNHHANGNDGGASGGDNNLVMPWGDTVRGDLISATILPSTMPGSAEEQYHMLYLADGAPKAGVGVAASTDGLHWSAAPEQRVEIAASSTLPVGDALVCIAEPSATGIANNGTPQEFTAYYRLPLRVASQPTLCRMQSHDLHHWTNQRAVLTTDEQDPLDAEVHGLTPFRYGELTLGLLWIHRRKTNSGELQLVSSRDGIEWTRVGDRTPLLVSGGPESFDHCGITRPTIPIVVGNELWFYYAGLGKSPTSGAITQQIGLATLMLDRFVALEADSEEGVVITTPIDCSTHTHLLLNAVVNARGYVLVEVLDGATPADAEENIPIPGYSRAEAIPFDGNAIYHRVGWREHDDLSDLGKRTIRLRFIICRAALYSFRLAHPEASVTDLLAGIC